MQHLDVRIIDTLNQENKESLFDTRKLSQVGEMSLIFITVIMLISFSLTMPQFLANILNPKMLSI